MERFLRGNRETLLKRFIETVRNTIYIILLISYQGDIRNICLANIIYSELKGGLSYE